MPQVSNFLHYTEITMHIEIHKTISGLIQIEIKNDLLFK